MLHPQHIYSRLLDSVSIVLIAYAFDVSDITFGVGGVYVYAAYIGSNCVCVWAWIDMVVMANDMKRK